MICRCLLAGIVVLVIHGVAWADRDATAEPQPRVMDFEGREVGALSRLASPVGVWRAEPAHAAVIDHPRTGQRCLRLLGGEARTVQLDLADRPSNRDVLAFRAERWTARSPFAFRVEGLRNGRWETLHTGDATIRVGKSFLSHVRITIPDPTIRQVRFVSTAPEDTGVLIDDVQLRAWRPARVTRIETVQPVTPVLIGAAVNDLLGVRVTVEGDDEPPAVRAIEIDLTGTNELSDVEKVEIFYTAERGLGQTGESLFGRSAPPKRTIRFDGEQRLQNGVNHFWVSCVLKADADHDHRIDAGCVKVELDDGATLRPSFASPPGSKRIGVALRQAGDDGAKVYRIPGLVRTNNGTLIAVYDVRYHGWGDLPGHIDVGMSRSTDGGRTWEPMQVVMDMGGDGDPKWRGDGIGDPAVLVDRETNTIWVAATWSHGNRSWRGSGPGLEPHETGQLMLVRSDDDGRTWSKPINITKQVKDPAWCFVLQGPGRGITMRDGTLIFAAQYQDPPNRNRLPHSTIIYSKDRGETWRIGVGAFDDTTESQVVELEPGVLMLNCRYNRAPYRVVMVTRDMGRTWTEHPTSRKALPEPISCMASLITLHVPDQPGRWLAFSNPHVTDRPRRHMTIQLSGDDGATWPARHRLLIDEGVSAGYSCMTQIDDETLGILYEGSRAHMTFQRIRIRDLFPPNGPHESTNGTAR